MKKGEKIKIKIVIIVADGYKTAIRMYQITRK